MSSSLGYLIGGIVILIALVYSVREIRKSIKSGGCNCSGCPSANKNIEKK